MVGPESRLFCRLDGLTPQVREQQRLKALRELGLLETEIIPVFEEATQTAARFLEAPICFLGLIAQETQWLKSAVGLSRVGLMNELATSRQIPRNETFCAYVVDSHQVLAIYDTNDKLCQPIFAESLLVQHYGIRSYLGTPLLTSDGICLGTLAVMDLVPRSFTSKDIEFLALMARWSLSEYERNLLLLGTRQVDSPQRISSSSQWFAKSSLHAPPDSYDHLGHNAATPLNSSDLLSLTRSAPNPSATTSVKAKLLSQLSQELRTPLTSVMGMASVLGREVYGPLTTKQKEYLEIIHHSGRHLVSLVDEILSLGGLDEGSQKLDFTSVDIEMLCQQAINSLEQFASGRQQQIRLSIEPGKRIWLLDKEKVRQILYYLIFNLINSGSAGGVVRIHVSRKGERLNISVWVSHPWLGDGLPQIEFYSHSEVSTLSERSEVALQASITHTQQSQSSMSCLQAANPMLLNGTGTANPPSPEPVSGQQQSNSNSRENLGLLLSCLLAEIHGGQISVQGSPDAGYRYVVSLPPMESEETFDD